ncbi:MAG: U32 family peptidase [Clostridia bacterium]|nr:U32 family peptidase [Clostridia bacterium]
MNNNSTHKRIELLAPCGDWEKLLTALHFGADAVYLAGKQLGLRAYSGNFTDEQIASACTLAHSMGRRVYVTVNIFARNNHFDTLDAYLTYLYNCGVDAIIVSDAGIIARAHEVVPNLPIHMSTQANITNSRAVNFWACQGVTRVVLARELSLSEIADIVADSNAEIETFVHGAMCMSYSGRCLLSNYFTGRKSNMGECAQPCRWEYALTQATVYPTDKTDQPMIVEEDCEGTYLFNSRDLNMLSYIDRLIQAGITSLKIEGRMKSPYYVATVVNAYRRAIDSYYDNDCHYRLDKTLLADLDKASHRLYTTGFYFDQTDRQNNESSRAVGESTFIAVVLSYNNGQAIVEMRNRFCVGDRLEILSSGDSFNKSFVVDSITMQGMSVTDAKVVQQEYCINCPYPVQPLDILRTGNKD